MHKVRFIAFTYLALRLERVYGVRTGYSPIRRPCFEFGLQVRLARKSAEQDRLGEQPPLGRDGQAYLTTLGYVVMKGVAAMAVGITENAQMTAGSRMKVKSPPPTVMAPSACPQSLTRNHPVPV